MIVVNKNSLNDLMEFDHVIMVDADGHVSEPGGIWAPEVTVQEGSYANPDVSAMHNEPWTLMNGYSGQYGYHGPVMHSSEFIGGKLAEDILAEPGYYVAVVVADVDSEDDDEPAGWAVARLELDEHKPA